jgi:hypothetical protein
LFPRAGAGADFARWDTIGPHASIAWDHGLSPDAVAILLLAAAPRMWGGLLHVYAAISGSVAIDEQTLATPVRSRMALVRELSREAPLLAFGVLSRRPTGAIAVDLDILRRLAGN